MGSFRTISVMLAVGALLLGSAGADTIGFSAAEGYVTGNLNGQPTSGGTWNCTSNAANIFTVLAGSSSPHADYLEVNLSAQHGSSSEMATPEYATFRMSPVTDSFTAGFSFKTSYHADDIGDETIIALGENADSAWGVYLGMDKTASGSIAYHDGSDWQEIATGMADQKWYNIEIAADISTGLFDISIFREDQRVVGDASSGLLATVSGLTFRDSPNELSYVMVSNEGSTKDTGGYKHYYDDLYLIPEPATLGLLAMGALTVLRSKKK